MNELEADSKQKLRRISFKMLEKVMIIACKFELISLLGMKL